MSNQQLYELGEAEYGNSTFRRVERVKSSKQHRPSMRGKRAKGPQSFNGMHRRRRRKIAW
jgi:hypothetical protein